MTNATRLFELAELAEASYANLIDTENNIGLLKTRLIDLNGDEYKFSQTQAEEFTKNWVVVSHQPNTASGYSGTLFKYIGNDPNSGFSNGQLVFAQRGTEPTVVDLGSADYGDIVSDGLALDQIVDLYNYWTQLNSAAGQPYSTAKLVTLQAETAAYQLAIAGQYIPAFNMAAGAYLAYLHSRTDIVIDEPLGLIRSIQTESSATLFSDDRQTGLGLGSQIAASTVMVAGHSLGGHLAAAFTRLFPEVGTETLTLNAAGFGKEGLLGLGANGGFNVRNLFGMLGGDTGFTWTNNHNLFGDKNPEFITMDGPGLFQPGTHDPLFIEQAGALENTLGHGSSPMIDSLAVANLFIKLDATLASETPYGALTKLNELFGLSSNQAAQSLERLVEDLSSYITGTRPVITIDDRESLYSAITQLVNYNGFVDLIGQVTLTQAPTNINEAKTDFGAFLSLVNMSPFALKPNDAGGAMYLQNSSFRNTQLAQQWEHDKSLTPQQIASGEQNFSDHWINDRIAMISALSAANKDDIDAISGSLSIFYDDFASSKGIRVVGNGIERQIIFGDDTDNGAIAGLAGDDHLYGGGGADTLTGNNGNDYLEGGWDNDTLVGGQGNDTLIGGDGTDTYIYTTGDGFDTLVDSDGLGNINHEGTELSGGQQYGDGRVHRDGQNRLYADIGKGIVVDGHIFILGFQPGDLGISFTGADAEPPLNLSPKTTNNILGDFKPLDTNPQEDGIQTTADPKTGNAIPDTDQPDPGHNDYLVDSLENDHVTSGGGDDLILAFRGGDDLIETGDGKDTVSAGNGNDVILGGAGDDKLEGEVGDDIIKGDKDRDTIKGDAGNDVLMGGGEFDILQGGVDDDKLYAEGNIDVAVAIAQGNLGGNGATDIKLTYTNQDGDWLSGEEGDDTLVGDKGADILAGGSGNDLMVGGAGDDYIKGDANATAANLNWKVEVRPGLPELLTNISIMEDVADPGNDVIYAGAGNDLVDAGEGDDVIYGEDGNDSLNGQEGNDIIVSGDGNDLVNGMAGDDVFAGGAGDDNLIGGSGYDTYIINSDEGKDTIIDPDRDSHVILGEGVDPANIILGLAKVSPYANDPTVYTALSLDLGNGNVVNLVGFNRNDVFNSSSVSSFNFANGTTLSINKLLDRGFDLDGTNANDTVIGTNTTDRINGMASVDLLIGGDGDDIIDGGDGDDLSSFNGNTAGDGGLSGGAGNDKIFGGAGNDELDGEEGNDQLDGGIGNDLLFGGNDNDRLEGGMGSDYLIGDSGDDTFVGGEGTDYFDGGAGDDTYLDYTSFDSMFDNQGNDTVILNDASGLDPVQALSKTGNSSVTVKLDNGTTLNFVNVYYGTHYNLKFNNGTTVDLESLIGSALNTSVSLQLGDEGGRLYGGSANDVLYGGTGNDTLTGNLGNDTLRGGVGNNVLNGGDGNDWLMGNGLGAGISGDDIIKGGAGNDDLFGEEGYDILDGGTGNDSLRGGSWNDQMVSGLGDDTLYGNTGADTLQGDDGSDILLGEDGDDLLNGGLGNDYLNGGVGSDTYAFDAGWGQDTINNFDQSAGKNDAIKFAAGILQSDIQVGRSYVGNDLYLAIKGGTDRITVVNYFDGDATGNSKVEAIGFADGTVWDVATVKLKTLQAADSDDYIQGFASNDTINGLGGYDQIYGNGGDDIINGGDGEDYVSGDDGNDTLNGGNGNDQLFGYYGDDLLIGGAGNDNLGGGLGSDTYVFGLGWGQDWISNFDDTIGKIDIIQFTAGILPADIKVSRSDNDLLLTLNDTTNRITVQNYFSNGTGLYNKIEEIQFADGTVWDFSTVKTRVLTGGNDDDTLFGFNSDDELNGGIGDDILVGLHGNDTLYGGAGDDGLFGDMYDVLDFTPGNDILHGGDGNDILREYYGNDILSGDAGNDELWAGAGHDVLNGGMGNDLAYGESGDDIVNGDAGIDYLDGGEGNDILNGGYGDDYLIDSEGHDVLNGNAGDDELWAGNGDDTVNGGIGNDRLHGDFFYSLDPITGLSSVGNDILNGGAGEDFLEGLDGNDLLNGGVGNDVLNGGAGSDTYLFNLGWGQDNIYNGEYFGNINPNKIDAIQFATGISTSDIEVFRTGNALILGFKGTADKITVKDYFITTGSDKAYVEQIRFADGTSWDLASTSERSVPATATQGNDLLYGTNFDDTIDGLAGDDELYGLGGNNILRGDAGNDSLNGGNGDDLLEGGNGNDYLDGQNGNNTLLGGAGDDILFAEYDDDILDGGLGTDEMDGWLGNDTYVVDNVLDIVLEGLDEGTDTIQSNITYTLGANIENLTLLGISIINGSGNALNNTLLGNNADNILSGGDGNDILDGGLGSDTLIGGKGNDRYRIDTPADAIKELAHAGIDTIETGISYSLATLANVENLTLIGSAATSGTGNDLNNILTGNAAVNTLTGLSGNDTYVVGSGDLVVELADEGIDLVKTTVNHTLSANVENLVLTGTSAINGEGNELDNSLKGNRAANTLIGNAGDDRLVGGASSDSMFGGTGNDVYVVDVATDTVTENFDEGMDTVETAVSYRLSNHVENLVIIGTLARNATGNALNNSLTGNSANNTLNGGAGNDILTGGAGSDSFLFNSILNSVTNKDTITDFSALDDTIKLENAIFTKFSKIGAITEGNFVSDADAVALDSDDFLVYDTRIGSLFYDADGNGAETQIEIVALKGNPALAAENFMIV